MFGALDTNSKWLYFAFNLMVKHPDVQSKIRKNINNAFEKKNYLFC